MERPQKRVRSDAELRDLLGYFERVPRDVVYKILLESGLSVSDVKRMCSLNTDWSRRICSNAFWDKLFIDRFLAKRRNMTEADRAPYYQSPAFLHWQQERAAGMTNNFAHLLRYAMLQDPMKDHTLYKPVRQSLTFSIDYRGRGMYFEYIKDTTHKVTPDELINMAHSVKEMLMRYLGTISVSINRYMAFDDRVEMEFGSMLIPEKFVYNAIVDGWTSQLDESMLGAGIISCAFCFVAPLATCANCPTLYCGQECADAHYKEHAKTCGRVD